ncbi:MAG: hypothetical protein IJH34_03965, partial [Romboutsia sp.]|nr:hypothetical protein [Romboutsia sp.]
KSNNNGKYTRNYEREVEELKRRYQKIKEDYQENNYKDSMTDKFYDIKEKAVSFMEDSFFQSNQPKSMPAIFKIIAVIFIIMFLGESIINMAFTSMPVLIILVIGGLVYYFKNNKSNLIVKFIKNIVTFGVRKK